MQPADLDRMQRRLRKLTQWDQDQIRYYQLCRKDQEQVMIEGQLTHDSAWHII